MAQIASPLDVAAADAVLKEVYGPDTIQSQLYDDALLYSQLERRTNVDVVGDKFIGFTKVGRNVGASSRSISQADGVKLGAPGHQQTKRWELDYAPTYIQIKILGTTIAKMQSQRQAAVQAIKMEVEGAITDIKKDIQRQLYIGSGRTAQCGTTSASTTVVLDPVSGYDAIVRSWLAVGKYIDIGTTGDADAVAAERKITAINDLESAPTITIDGTAVTTSSSHYISTAGNRSASDGTSYEMNGLGTLVSDTGTFAAIDPTTVPEWKSHVVDANGAALARSHMQEAYRKARQFGGAPDWVLTSLDHQEDYYNLLQSQVRFAGDAKLASGKVEGPLFNDIPVAADPDCPRKVMYFLDSKNLFLVTDGDIRWHAADSHGGVLDSVLGEDAYQGAAKCYSNLGTDKRRAHSLVKGLATS